MRRAGEASEVDPLRKRLLRGLLSRKGVRGKAEESLLRDVVIVFVANCLKAWQTREELRGGRAGDNPPVNIEL